MSERVDRVNKLFQSLYKPELHVTWYPQEIRDLMNQNSFLKETMDNPSPEVFKTKKERDVFKKDAVKQLADNEAQIEVFKKELEVAQEEFLFTKLTQDEHSRCEESVGQAFNKFTQEEKKVASSPEEQERLRCILDPQGVFSQGLIDTDSGLEDVGELREKAIEMMVEQILIADGKSLEWATSIQDDDLEMELTDEEEHSLEIDERLEPEDKVKATLDMEDNKLEILRQKRERLINTRTKERDERKGKLHAKGFEALLEVLNNYRILSKANQKAMFFAQDAQIYYAVKDPKAPITRDVGGAKVIAGYQRYFNSPEQVEHLRENYEEFYGWLCHCYEELQEIRTKEDAERVARSSLFLFGV